MICCTCHVTRHNLQLSVVTDAPTLPDSRHLPPLNDFDHERFINGFEVVGHDNFVPIVLRYRLYLTVGICLLRMISTMSGLLMASKSLDMTISSQLLSLTINLRQNSLRKARLRRAAFCKAVNTLR